MEKERRKVNINCLKSGERWMTVERNYIYPYPMFNFPEKLKKWKLIETNFSMHWIGNNESEENKRKVWNEDLKRLVDSTEIGKEL